MKTLKLTPRLNTVAYFINHGSSVADIGTDHGYLPTWLILNEKITSAIASDIGIGPLNSARKTAEEYKINEKLSFRLGGGLEKISPSECDTIVIAGMGGETISNILEDAQWTKNGEHLLLLQPMTMAQELRFYLLNNGFIIKDEKLCKEGRRIYTVIAARGSQSKMESKKNIWECCVSSQLLKDPLAHEYLNRLLEREENAICGLLKSVNSDENELYCKQKTVEHLKRVMEEHGL